MQVISRGLALVCAALASLGVQAQSHSTHESGHAHHVPAQAGHSAHSSRMFPDPASVQAPDGVSVTGCWIRALPNRLPAAGYFSLQNSGSADAVLVGAQSEGFGRVMLHTHETRGGLSTMVHLDQVVVPAGGEFAFAPGGHHVMLEQADFDLVVGTRHPLVLWFEGDRALRVECDVRPPGTRH